MFLSVSLSFYRSTLGVINHMRSDALHLETQHTLIEGNRIVEEWRGGGELNKSPSSLVSRPLLAFQHCMTVKSGKWPGQQVASKYAHSLVDLIPTQALSSMREEKGMGTKLAAAFFFPTRVRNYMYM